MAKTIQIRELKVRHYLLFTIVACWGMFTTVLSHDRIFYGVASYAAQQSQRVANKYAPPVITKEVQVACQQPTAQAMPPQKSLWEVSKADIPDLPHAGWATLERAR